MIKKLNNKGDTLVEVMIAVAVLAFILASSYTLSSYAARLGQSAKERNQAVAYAQQQAEIIQAYAARDWNSLVDMLPASAPAPEQHFNSDWLLESGGLIYPVDEVAANYEVSTTLKDKLCESICSSTANVRQLEFEIEVSWQPASPGPVDQDTGNPELDSTKLIVKVSPPGESE